jgi:hypothetical protein
VNGKVRGLRIIVRDGVHLKEKGHGSPDGPAAAITMPRMSVRVHGFALRGIEAVPCEVEVDLSGQGLPRTTLVGLPDVAVREAIDHFRKPT